MNTIVKKHYDTLLGNIYSWMTGDFETAVNSFQNFLQKNGLVHNDQKTALDLGAGHGIQSVALAKSGYSVTAVDFSQQLLDELSTHANDLPIEVVNDDILHFIFNENKNWDLIICWGDTLTHLKDIEDMKTFLNQSIEHLNEQGHLLLSFRDYSVEMEGNQRFIPVKSSEEQILTCFLEYEKERVRVSDLLHIKENNQWIQKVSAYYKTRVNYQEVIELLEKQGLSILLQESKKGLIEMVARKG